MDARGVTMVELVLVCMLLGVLAAITGLQLNKISEKSRATEATAYLATLRSAEVRYRTVDPGLAYTNQLDALDVELPATLRFWTGPVLSAPGTTGMAEFTRTGGSYHEETVGIQYGTATLCGTFTPLQPLSACAPD